MAGTKEPRVALRNPREFGRIKGPQILSTASPAHAQAALIQSELARRAREEMVRSGVALPSLAKHLSISAETLRRQLRGEQAMTLERMYAISLHLRIGLSASVED